MHTHRHTHCWLFIESATVVSFLLCRGVVNAALPLNVCVCVWPAGALLMVAILLVVVVVMMRMMRLRMIAMRFLA